MRSSRFSRDQIRPGRFRNSRTLRNFIASQRSTSGYKIATEGCGSGKEQARGMTRLSDSRS
jgi:hypothetical protein